MNRLKLIVVYLNIFGLAAVQGLESWRWGTISSILSMTWIWLGSAVFIGAAIVLDRQRRPDTASISPRTE